VERGSRYRKKTWYKGERDVMMLGCGLVEIGLFSMVAIGA
jgi:hypothetical protein